MIAARRALLGAGRGVGRGTAAAIGGMGSGARAQLGNDPSRIIGSIQRDTNLCIGDLGHGGLGFQRGIRRATPVFGCSVGGIALAAEQPVDRRLEGEADDRQPVHPVDPTMGVAPSGAPIEASGSAPAADSRAINFGSSVSPIHFAVAGAWSTA